MSVLCAIGSLLWFVTFVALTGILTGVSAAFRLVEVTISFVNPLVIFMLRVSNRLILFAICLSARVTYQAYNTMCTSKSSTIAKPVRMEINLRAPEVPYSRCQLPNQVQETTLPVAPAYDVASTSDEPVVEADEDEQDT